MALGRYGFLGGGGGGSFILACWEWGLVFAFLVLCGGGWGVGGPRAGWGVGGVFLSGAVLGTFLVRGRYGNICAC